MSDDTLWDLAQQVVRFDNDTSTQYRLAREVLSLRSALAAAREEQIPLCGGHADAWFTGRDHLIGGLDAGCVVCAFGAKAHTDAARQESSDVRESVKTSKVTDDCPSRISAPVGAAPVAAGAETFEEWWLQRPWGHGKALDVWTQKDAARNAHRAGVREGLERAAKLAERTRTSPSPLIGATWQEPIYRDGPIIARAIRALSAEPEDGNVKR